MYVASEARQAADEFGMRGLDMLGSQPTPHEPTASADEPRSSSA
ncbi:hypothetical protein ACWC09_28545 [Streptomyces sp. NPDC001617]